MIWFQGRDMIWFQGREGIWFDSREGIWFDSIPGKGYDLIPGKGYDLIWFKGRDMFNFREGIWFDSREGIWFDSREGIWFDSRGVTDNCGLILGKGDWMRVYFAYWVKGILLPWFPWRSSTGWTGNFVPMTTEMPSLFHICSLNYYVCRGIMSLCNSLVYEERLQCGSDEVATRCLHLPFYPSQHSRVEPDWLDRVLHPQAPVLFLDTDECTDAAEISVGGHVCNRFEAKLVARLVMKLRMVMM
jgi:hypothetical protein